MDGFSVLRVTNVSFSFVNVITLNLNLLSCELLMMAALCSRNQTAL